MADFLILGDPDHLRTFVSAAHPDHSWYTITDDPDRLDGSGIIAADDRRPVPARLDAIFELSTVDDGAKHEHLALISDLARQGTIVYTNALTMTATAAAALLGGRDGVVGLSFVPDLFASSQVVEIAPALRTSAAEFERARLLLKNALRREPEIVTDRIGLVSARVLAMIVNEAAFALMEGVADPADIDTAMRLGTNYPEGPLAWGDRIGIDLVLAILEALYKEYREERYRPCVLLRQYSRAGLTFHQHNSEPSPL